MTRCIRARRRTTRNGRVGLVRIRQTTYTDVCRTTCSMQNPSSNAKQRFCAAQQISADRRSVPFLPCDCMPINCALCGQADWDALRAEKVAFAEAKAR